MSLSKSEREELKALSKDVFGVSSKYQRFLDGVREVVTREIQEEVPGENGVESTFITKKVPVLVNGVRKTHLKRYTFEETRDMMLGWKKQRDDIMEGHRKLQEEKQKSEEQKRLVDNVQRAIAGSSV